MAQKKVLIPGIGEVLLAKRRGSTHLRLSITAKGVVRVGLPYWVPYAAGINFAKQRTDWINKHLSAHGASDFKTGDHVGKSHTLNIIQNPALNSPSSRITQNEITVSSPYEVSHPSTQKKVVEACNRALRKESETLLPQRLRYLAVQHGFSYKDVRIRSLTSRWGSCSANKTITLSYFLIQLPWNLIDYVLLHELVHTQHMNHAPAFWAALERVMPGAKKMRKQVNAHKPRPMANSFID